MGTVVITIMLLYFFWKLSRSKSVDSPTIITPDLPAITPELLETDSWEGSFFGGAIEPKRVTAKLLIKYVDSNHLETHRTIKVREFDVAPQMNGLILAFCELRDANRSFRYDRIKECIDLETGEIISDVRQFLNKKYLQSPDHSLDTFFQDYLLPLECLAFIAKADGAVRKEEKELIIDFCRTYLLDTRVEEKDILAILGTIEHMSIAKFRRIVTQVLELDNKVVENLLKTAAKIISTDKKTHPAEREAFDYLHKRFSKKVEMN